MMLLADFHREAVASLSSLYPPAEARSIVNILCSRLPGVTSYTHIVEPGTIVEPAMEDGLASALSRLMSGEPVQYVVGYAMFCERSFRVGPSVLIPRPETEILCADVIAEAGRRLRNGTISGPPRILDLCTGSGCIAWTLALEIPGAEVFAADISGEALKLAEGQEFAQGGQTFRRPSFFKADILDTESFPATGQYDIMVSNPPYVRNSEKSLMRRNVLDYEPALALFVPDDDPLLFYRAVSCLSLKLLAPNGFAAVEINESLGEETSDVFRKAGFYNIEIIKDLHGKDRFVRYSF